MTNTSTTYLTKDSLFLKLPTHPIPSTPSSSITFNDLYNDLNTDDISFDSIINKTYYLLKSNPININICLKLWQIRLTCHLFNNNLNYAKKELINLNNSLYLHENHNISPSTLNSINSSSNQNTSGNNPIYPLPKNNLMIIDYKLLILLMRLKNLPNLNLTNELYKLIWQIRLKNNNNSSIIGDHDKTNHDEMNIILQNLSFDNIVILIITKNFQTLINFLDQLIKQLNKSKNEQYYSNICLIYVIINLIVYCKKNKINGILNHVEEIWNNEINQFSKKSLNYSLQKISPIINQNIIHDNKLNCNTIENLIELINNDLLTGRIICSTLGIWDLLNNYQFQLSESKDIDGLQFTKNINNEESKDISTLSDEELVNECVELLENQWCDYINKVYGLE